MPSFAKCAAPAVAALAAIAVEVPIATGAVIEAPFDAAYTLVDLGSVPGLPTNYGGLTVKLGDPATILIGGAANSLVGALHAVTVVRDVEGHISGFAGSAVAAVTAEYNDGGVVYGPNGVLFLARWPINELGQAKAGSSFTDKVISLAPFGVPSSLSAINFVPAGFAQSGHLKMVTYGGGSWFDATIAADGAGTFDVTSVTAVPTSNLAGGPEGFTYVPSGSPLIADPSMIVSEYSGGSIAVYHVDTDGNPIVATRQTFITGLSGAEGATVDPLTGDFLFSTFSGGNHVIVVRGFRSPPPTCVADINGDGVVDGADLGALLGNWGGSGQGDLNTSGAVDGADLGILLGAWGPCP